MTFRGHIRNGQITLDEPASLPEGAEVNVEVMPAPRRAAALTRCDILRMPLDQRRQLLMQQSDGLQAHYQSDANRSDWQGGDIVE